MLTLPAAGDHSGLHRSAGLLQLLHPLCNQRLCAAANLASSLLQSSTFSRTITSISELLDKNQYTLCVGDEVDGLAMSIMIPGLHMETVRVETASGWKASMDSGNCDAWVAHRPELKLIYSQADLCQLTTIVTALCPEFSGRSPNSTILSMYECVLHDGSPISYRHACEMQSNMHWLS